MTEIVLWPPAGDMVPTRGCHRTCQVQLLTFLQVAISSPEGSLWKTQRHTFVKSHNMLFLQQLWGGAWWGTIFQG